MHAHTSCQDHLFKRSPEDMSMDLYIDDVKYEEEFIVNSRDTKLFTCAWMPRDSEPKALIFVCHGIAAECSVSMRDTASRLVRAGYAVYGIDHEGHGRSCGQRCYVPNFSDIVDDCSSHFMSVCATTAAPPAGAPPWAASPATREIRVVPRSAPRTPPADRPSPEPSAARSRARAPPRRPAPRPPPPPQGARRRARPGAAAPASTRSQHRARSNRAAEPVPSGPDPVRPAVPCHTAPTAEHHCHHHASTCRASSEAAAGTAHQPQARPGPDWARARAGTTARPPQTPSSHRGPDERPRHQRRPAQSRRCAPPAAQRPWPYKPENRGKKRFLYGISMGGSVALLLHRKEPAFWDGAVLLAPMCKISDDMKPHPVVVSALKMVCAVAPGWRIIPIPDIIDKVCKDPEMRKHVRSNPYIYRGKLPLKTCHELLMVSLDIEKNLHEVSLPFLVLHGGDDVVTDPSASKLLFEEASSGDKAFKLYPGMWHALTAELPQDAERVYSDIISWLDQRANCAANVGTASA